MRALSNPFAIAAIAILLGGADLAAAKPVTMANITIDLPSSFKASDSERGMKTQSSDGEVDVWFERFPANGLDAFVSENIKYWTKNKVDLPKDPTSTEGKMPNGRDYQQMDYPGASWKGKPTIVRYVFFKPSADAQADMIVVTIWASPDGDKAHSDEISTMIEDAKVN